MRNLTMADDFRNFGLAVIEDANWRNRGNEYPRKPRGSVNHHTACGFCGERDPSKCRHLYPSGNILIFGRPDVPGPLANAGQQRDDVVHVIASGKSNNAGRGGVAGLDSNYDVHGLEVEYSGQEGEAFPFARFDTSARVHAAWGWRLGYDAGMVFQHFEWTPRKIDMLRAALNRHGGVSAFRNRIQHYIDHPPHLQIIEHEPVIDYRLDRVLKVGDRDTHDNRIVTRVENLLLWNAEKYGRTGSRPGKVDGVFTATTADAVQSFREMWWEKFDKVRPASQRHFSGPFGREVGPKVYDALVFAATI